MEKKNKVNLRNRKTFNLFSITATILFFIFTLNLASAYVIPFIQNPVSTAELISSSDGNYGGQPYLNTLFLPDGYHVYELDRSDKTDTWIYSGEMLDQFDISSITFTDTYKVNDSFGVECAGTTQYQVSAYFITDNGKDMYINYNCGFSHLASGGGINVLHHYNLTMPYNVSSAVQLEERNEFHTSSIYGNFFFSGFGSIQVNGQVTSIYVSPDGRKLVEAVNLYYSNGAGAFTDYGTVMTVWTLCSPGFMLDCYSYRGTFILKNETSYSLTSDGLALIGKSIIDKKNMTIYEYALRSSYDFSDLSHYYIFNNSNNSNIISQNDYSSKPLIFTKDGGTYMIVNSFNENDDRLRYRLYGISNASFFFNGTQPTGNDNPIVIYAINPILSLFPNSTTITSTQKYTYVVITMLLIALILLLGVGSIIKSVPSPLIYVTLVIELALFVFFISIGYISVGLLIMLALIGGAVGFIMVKLKGSGG